MDTFNLNFEDFFRLKIVPATSMAEEVIVYDREYLTSKHFFDSKTTQSIRINTLVFIICRYGSASFSIDYKTYYLSKGSLLGLNNFNVINDVKRLDVVEQRVDGEVAALRVLLRRAEGVVLKLIRRTLLLLRGVFGRAAEGGGFDDFVVVENDVREAESAADEEAVSEEPLERAGVGVGADVEVLGLAAEQEVAHAAAHEVGDVPRGGEALEDAQRVGVNVLARNVVLASRTVDDFWAKKHGRLLYHSFHAFASEKLKIKIEPAATRPRWCGAGGAGRGAGRLKLS